ncbi:unnamed protein product [Larinioides sclopetarius]|uniref:Uncharacterized protein n=1 Tax=Larinioides sclopetarius TaxID=280406 RepID=A0AAV1Z127_9ARAC
MMSFNPEESSLRMGKPHKRTDNFSNGVLSAEDNGDEIIDSSAEDCRRQLNNCLDQVEDRVPGVFDMDYCCDEYKKCMYKIGRNRP